MMVVNAKKHFDYWRRGAEEDWDVARKLVIDGKTRHGLFFAHLEAEEYILRSQRVMQWLTLKF